MLIMSLDQYALHIYQSRNGFSNTKENTNEQKGDECPVWGSVHAKGEGKMYGLLLESVQFYVIQDVGEHVWNKILEHAGYKNIVFTTHTTYRDEIMTQLARSCYYVTKTKDYNQWMTFFGVCFVDFCSGYGYDKLLQVTGRHYRDFLHGIDNIHEMIRFSYPRLCSPSFLVLSEDREGCVLLYQSKRKGFKFYVIGQLQQIAKRFYKVTVKISVIEEVTRDRQSNVKFRLDFDNSAYAQTKTSASKSLSGNNKFSNITGSTFLKVFPFCIVFNSQLVIKQVGTSMAAFIREENFINAQLGDKFHIRRPLIPCIWSKILQFQRVIFELEYIGDNDGSHVNEFDHDSGIDGSVYEEPISTKSGRPLLLLRGQMKYMEEWDMVTFLCSPLMNNVSDLSKAGMFINDLNMYDKSRDLVLTGCQHASTLERSIEQQREKSEKISENMTKIEEWNQKSDSLLYAMIPKSVAFQLKSGCDPISTCEVFDNVTIMFNYMVGFGDVCSSATPMEIVKIINSVFILFDQITDKYDVFKVETLGDAVYMVAGGVPDRNPNHAINVAGLALELQEKAQTLVEPWYQEYKLSTRIGMHTGSVVGGVVGRRTPQYCLFGDTVNTASRMQTYSQPGRIHISEPTRECLKGSNLVTIVRGTVNVKGKGEMRTFWLAGRDGDERTKKFCDEVRQERSEAVRKYSSYENAMDLHGMHASTSYAQMPANFGYLRQNKSVPHMTSDVSLDERTRASDRITSQGSFLSTGGSPRQSISNVSSRASLKNTGSKPCLFSVGSRKSLQSNDSIDENDEDSTPPDSNGAKPKFTITSPEKTNKAFDFNNVFDANEKCSISFPAEPDKKAILIDSSQDTRDPVDVIETLELVISERLTMMQSQEDGLYSKSPELKPSETKGPKLGLSRSKFRLSMPKLADLPSVISEERLTKINSQDSCDDSKGTSSASLSQKLTGENHENTQLNPTYLKSSEHLYKSRIETSDSRHSYVPTVTNGKTQNMHEPKCTCPQTACYAHTREINADDPTILVPATVGKPANENSSKTQKCPKRTVSEISLVSKNSPPVLENKSLKPEQTASRNGMEAGSHGLAKLKAPSCPFFAAARPVCNGIEAEIDQEYVTNKEQKKSPSFPNGTNLHVQVNGIGNGGTTLEMDNGENQDRYSRDKSSPGASHSCPGTFQASINARLKNLSLDRLKMVAMRSYQGLPGVTQAWTNNTDSKESVVESNDLVIVQGGEIRDGPETGANESDGAKVIFRLSDDEEEGCLDQ